MKLLFLTEFFQDSGRPTFTGGVEARTHYIKKYLQLRHQIWVISSNSQQISATFFSLLPRLLFQLVSIFKATRFRPNLIEGSNFVSYLPAFISAKLLGIPAIAWYADVYGKVWFTNFTLPTAVSGFLIEKLSLSLPWSHIIAMSESTKTKLIKHGVPRNRITMVHGGVDLKTISKINAKPFKTPTICTAARLVPYKRIQDLIKAVYLVNQQNYRLNLIIIGDGPQRRRLQVLARRLKISSKVNFKGNIPHPKVLQIIKSCHFFSLPSLVEGFGLVTIEAAACATPFINSRIPPTVEITHNGQGGLLFEPKNPLDLSAKIIKLMTNKKFYQSKKTQALKLASKYDWSIIAKQTEAVYFRYSHLVSN